MAGRQRGKQRESALNDFLKDSKNVQKGNKGSKE